MAFSCGPKRLVTSPKLTLVDLPVELLSLIIHADHIRPSEASGLPLVCRALLPFGRALVWREMSFTLGRCTLAPAFEALMDQPHRRLVDRAVLTYNNTAIGLDARDARHEDALRDCADVLNHLPAAKSLSIVVNPATTAVRVLPDLIERVLASPLAAKLGRLHLDADTGRGLLLDDFFSFLPFLPSLRHLSVETRILPTSATTSLPFALTTLVIRRDDREPTQPSSAVVSLVRGIKSTLRRLSYRGDDSGAQALVEELRGPGFALRSLELHPPLNKPSFLFRVGPGQDSLTPAAGPDIIDSTATIFPHHPHLVHLSLGDMFVRILEPVRPVSSARPTRLECPQFWASLPEGLEYLSLQCRLARNPEPVLGFLKGGRCPRLRTLAVGSSEGRATSLLCTERNIEFRESS